MKKCLLILFAVLLTTKMTFAGEVVIIANPGVPNEALSQTEIADIFLGKVVKWPDKKILNLC